MAEPQKFVAIGDIHGCIETLKQLISRLSDYSDRTFVFVGDYIDRGPSSKEVVDFLIEFSKTKTCVFLRGNHEQMLLDGKDGMEAFAHWQRNGGRETMQSYGQTQMNFQLPSNHFHFFRNTRLFFEADAFVFVHGGFNPELSLREQLDADESQQFDHLWERAHLKTDTSHWEKTVVFGHTPKADIIFEAKKIGIDTGCVFKNLPGLGLLTAVLLPEVTFVQQKCLDKPKPY